VAFQRHTIAIHTRTQLCTLALDYTSTWVLQVMHVNFYFEKKKAPTSMKTTRCIINSKRLMLLREVIAVYCENHMCSEWETADSFMSKQTVHTVDCVHLWSFLSTFLFIKLTPRRGVFVGKLSVAHHLNKFVPFVELRRFVTVFTKPCHRAVFLIYINSVHILTAWWPPDSAVA
jgi:hypothetical protein